MAADATTVALVERALEQGGCPGLVHGAAAAASFCHRSESAIRRAIVLHQLRALRVGSSRGRYLFLRSDLAAFLAAAEGA